MTVAKKSIDLELLEAVAKKNLASMQELLRTGANINCSGDDGYTPLIAAIVAENAIMAEELLHYADADRYVEERLCGKNACELAYELPDEHPIRRMLFGDHRLLPTKLSRPDALEVAIRERRRLLIGDLVDFGAGIMNEQIVLSEDFLHIPYETARKILLKTLTSKQCCQIEYCLLLIAERKPDRDGAITWQKRRFCSGHVMLLGELQDILEQRGDVTRGMSLIDRAFMQAANRGDIAVLKAMVEAGANINATDSDGYTALHAAIDGERLEVADVLLELPVDLDITDSLCGLKAVDYLPENHTLADRIKKKMLPQIRTCQ